MRLDEHRCRRRGSINKSPYVVRMEQNPLDLTPSWGTKKVFRQQKPSENFPRCFEQSERVHTSFVLGIKVSICTRKPRNALCEKCGGMCLFYARHKRSSSRAAAGISGKYLSGVNYQKITGKSGNHYRKRFVRNYSVMFLGSL